MLVKINIVKEWINQAFNKVHLSKVSQYKLQYLSVAELLSLGCTKLNICFWYTLPPEIDQAIWPFILITR